MGSNTVSVIIPTYNFAPFIVDAVESVLAQTYTDHEIIVVDDGSRDGTRERLEPYTDRIRYIYQDNGGPSSARNTGIRQARGELIGFLDADDLWHPRKLEVQVRFLREHPEIGIVGASHTEDFGAEWAEVDRPGDPPWRSISYHDLIVKGRFGPSAALIRRECFDEAGPFDVTLRGGEDRDMWIRIGAIRPVAILEQPLWKYRIHRKSATRATRLMEENVRRLHEKIFNSPEGRRLPASVRRRSRSIAAFYESHGYAEDREYGRALAKFLESVLSWPLPYPRNDVPPSLVRLKFLAMLPSKVLRPGAPRSDDETRS